MPECTICHTTHTKLFGEKDGHTLYRCLTCAFVFVYPLPDSSAVYSEDYFTGATHGFGYVDYDHDKAPMVPTFNEYLRRMKMLMSPPARLLDVGAATGFFLEIARDHGFEVAGVEISAFAAEEGRKKGIEMVTGTLKDVSQEKPFEIITMFDLIEHVEDPRAELKRTHTLLSPGGLLVINTPDIGSLYARIMGKRWHLIVPPEHLYYFTRSNMKRILEEEGFEVLSVGTVGKRFTLSYIFKTLHTWQKLALWKYLSKLFERGFLSRIALPVNLYDNMFVIARKI